MTILEALQAVTEYSNTNLLEKILLDLDLVSTATYSSDDYEDVELASAYVFRQAALAPDFTEGGLHIKWSAAQLNAEANRILAKYEIEDESGSSIIDGTSQW